MTILNERGRQLEKSVWSKEGIGLETPEIRARQDANLGSQILREACLDLFQRTANRYRIGLSDAMACHLGHHAPAKIIRSPASLYHGRIAA